jgi:hypothetical protein
MTIKTQVVDGKKRAITKVVDGKTKVSCTCCAEPSECCMYPADQLGIGYTEDDLPNEVYVFVADTNTPPTINLDEILTRSGSEYTNGTGARLFVEVGLFWRIEIDDIPFFGRPCLIDSSWPFAIEQGPELFGANSIQDTFPDELNREGAIGPAERVSLCQWCLEGDELNDGAFTVIYFDGQATTDCNGRFFPTSLTPHSWYLAPVGDGLYRKTGNQNTPIGTYEAINTPGLTQEIT